MKLLRREGALIVTEVEPLVAYVLSMPLANVFDSDKVAQFTTFLELELAVHGTIHITTDTGLFEAF